MIETGIDDQGTAFLVKGIGLVTCLHNVWDIKREVEEEELKDILKQKVKIYLPSNPQRTYPFELKYYDHDQDLIVFDLPYTTKDHGLESVMESPIIGKSLYFSAGYPNYAPGNSIDWLDDFKVRSRTRNHKQTLYVIDNQFLKGASGGPVFNKENKVIGFIDRGDENTAESRIESAFCLLTPLLNLISD